MLAKDIMTKEVFSVNENDTVDTVIKLLLEKEISGAPVVDSENRLVGVISEGDLIYKSKTFHFPLYYSIFDSYIFLEKPSIIEDQLEKMTGYKVKDVMTKDVISVNEDATINKMATIMTEKDINRIPVVDNENKLVGIVARRDIIRSYSESSEEDSI